MCYNEQKTGFRPVSILKWIAGCIMLNLLWLLGCIPVVTAGASCAALYAAVLRTCRRGEAHGTQQFSRVFRRDWKLYILPTAVVLSAFAGLLFGMVQLWNAGETQKISFGLFAAGELVSILLLGMLSLVFPMMNQFENPFGSQLKNSALMGLLNLPKTMVLGIINGGTALLCVRFVFPVLFLPVLASLLSSFLIEPMFKPFLKKEAA